MVRFRSRLGLPLLVAALHLSGCYLGAQQMLDGRWPGSGSCVVVGPTAVVPVEGPWAVWGQVLLVGGGDQPLMFDVPVGAAWALGGRDWPEKCGKYGAFWYAGCGVVPVWVNRDQDTGWTVGAFAALGCPVGPGGKLEFRLKLAPDYGGDLSDLNPSSISVMMIWPCAGPPHWLW